MGIYADRIFPFLMDRVTRRFEPDRREVLASARGAVLEVGSGTGSAFPHYPAGVTRVVAVEPSRGMNRRARRRLGRFPPRGRPPIHLVRAAAEALPFVTGSFDTAVAFLVLCTVADPQPAAAELRRILRPGGELLVFEHVRAPSGRLARWQDRLNPLWKPVALGCHLNRDSRALLEEAGFRFRSVREYWHDDVPAIAGRILSGRAVP